MEKEKKMKTILLITIIILAILMIGWLIVVLSKRKNDPLPRGGKEPLDLIEERFKRNEISESEYQKLKRKAKKDRKVI